MNDFVRVASAVIKTTVADTTKNTEEHIKMMEKSSSENVDITVFPELSITGYTCQDLFFQKELLDKTYSSLIEIKKKSEKLKGIFVVGAPIKHKNQLFNCAVVISKGTVYGIVPKTYLPNYNEFYEKRWFSTSMDTEDTFINFDGEEVPFSQNVFDANGFTFGVEICEDLWTPVPPSTVLSMSGAEIILNLSASNALIGKRDYVNSMVKQNSGSNIATYVYCSASSGESTQDLIYSGHSIICENGVILKENKEIIENNYLLITDTDLGKIRFDRLKNKSYKDCITNNMFSTFDTVNVDYLSDSEIVSNGEMYYIDKTPFVPSNNSKKLERCLEIFSMQVEGLRKRISVIGGKMVVGVSGGLDSTLALLVCGEVCRRMGKPMTDVVGVTMPCFGTTDRTYNNSLDLMRTLGITTMEIPIADSCRQHMKDIGHNEEVHDITYENVQARERTQVLMDVANKVGGIVVGTGDLSELALGWCTYNADHMSMYGVNCSVPKTLVRYLVLYYAETTPDKQLHDVLMDVLDTPVSPELLPPDKDGKIAQKTEDLVGPYELHDFFLYYIMRFGYTPSKIYRLAKYTFDGDYDKETIYKWLRTFYWRFFAQQFKRSCLPDGPKVGSVALSPRGDWRMPSDASVNMWIKDIENIEV